MSKLIEPTQPEDQRRKELMAFRADQVASTQHKICKKCGETLDKHTQGISNCPVTESAVSYYHHHVGGHSAKKRKHMKKCNEEARSLIEQVVAGKSVSGAVDRFHSITEQYHSLTPAYGRDYKSKKEVEADWHANKDFILQDGLQSAYFNKEQATPGHTYNIRYKKNTLVHVIKHK